MLFLSLLGLLSIQVLASSIALRPRDGGLKPFAFTPSLTWDGNDGTWSTFIVRVGTPPQSFRVLPSTAARELVIPLVDGCIRSDPPNCGDLRGAYPFDNKASSGFLVNKSSTWDNNRLYELVLDKELNLTNNALYGFDSVGLQVDQSGGLELDHQIVAGIATKDFYLGLFGLAPEPTNFSTTFSEPKQSFMVTLKEAKKIPSLSYGYTAGAKYSNKGVLGSLTLGGYDTSRFTPNNISFTFGVEDTRLILVGIQSITAANTLDGMRTLLTDGIFSLIDTSLPYIWLPEAACNNFQTAFGLTYDPKTQLYLVNDTIHAKLKEAQPSITFKLGNKLLGGEYINIALPYSAFDLQAKHPIYPNTTNYFPIRKAANDTQYVIGRSFFQEAYVSPPYFCSVYD